MLDSPKHKGKRLGVGKARSKNLSSSQWVAFVATYFDKRWVVNMDNHRSRIHMAWDRHHKRDNRTDPAEPPPGHNRPVVDFAPADFEPAELVWASEQAQKFWVDWVEPELLLWNLPLLVLQVLAVSRASQQARARPACSYW